MILGFRIDHPDASSVKFLHDLKERLDQPFNALSMPFTKKRLAYVSRDVWALQLQSAWPPLYLYGLFYLGLCVGLRFPWWAYLISLPFLLLWLAEWPAFYLLMLRQGLRRQGFKGRVEQVKAVELLEVALWGR